MHDNKSIHSKTDLPKDEYGRFRVNRVLVEIKTG